MKKYVFNLYRINMAGEKTVLMHIEEDIPNKTYYIKVEADNIEAMLFSMMLPEVLKQHLREDIVNIVKGYNDLVVGKFYSEFMRESCIKYFTNSLEKFCFNHGTKLFEYDKQEIDIDA